MRTRATTGLHLLVRLPAGRAVAATRSHNCAKCCGAAMSLPQCSIMSAGSERSFVCSGQAFLSVLLRALPLGLLGTLSTTGVSGRRSLPACRPHCGFETMEGLSGPVAVNGAGAPPDKQRVYDQPNNQPPNYSHVARPASPLLRYYKLFLIRPHAAMPKNVADVEWRKPMSLSFNEKATLPARRRSDHS